MDPITHTLVGVGLGNAFFRRRSGPPATVVLALASNLPDLDGIVMLTMGQAGVVMRRTFGHSLLLLPIWVVLLAGLLGWFVPRIRFPARVGLVALGALFHLFFDLVNSFGVVLLWPLSDWRPELAIVFIVDLVLAGLLAAPLLLALSRRFRARIIPFSRGAVALAALYVALCGAARVRAEGILAREAETLRPRPEFSYVFPEPLGPQHWRGVLRQDGTYRIYLVDPIQGRAELRREVSTAGDSPAVRRVRGSPWGRRLENFFKAPVWEVERAPGIRQGVDAGGEGASGAGEAKIGAAVEVRGYDLRFSPLVVDRPPLFVFPFRVAGGEVRRLF